MEKIVLLAPSPSNARHDIIIYGSSRKEDCWKMFLEGQLLLRGPKRSKLLLCDMIFHQWRGYGEEHGKGAWTSGRLYKLEKIWFSDPVSKFILWSTFELACDTKFIHGIAPMRLFSFFRKKPGPSVWPWWYHYQTWRSTALRKAHSARIKKR